MRRGSRQAYRSALANWDALMSNVGHGECDFARELFFIADMIADSPALAGALDDKARAADDRAQLAFRVFNGHVSGEVSDMLQGLVRESWSEEGDLVRSIEALGVQTLLAGAEREHMLERVENELYSIKSLLLSNRELYNALRNSVFPMEQRHKLAARVTRSATVYVQEFMRRALEQSVTTHIEDSFDAYIDAVGQRCQHTVASVVAAVPLSEQQEDRLSTLLARMYGKDVRIHTSVDPAVIGGIKVTIGSDIIDGTIATKLDNLKKVFINRR